MVLNEIQLAEAMEQARQQGLPDDWTLSLDVSNSMLPGLYWTILDYTGLYWTILDIQFDSIRFFDIPSLKQAIENEWIEN